MVQLLRPNLLAAATLLLAFPAAPAPSGIPTRLHTVDKSFRLVYVHGAIERADGAPAPFAAVLAWSDNGSCRVRADEQGLFRAGPFSPGDTVHMHASAAGLMSALLTLEPLPRHDQRGLRITLKPGVRFEGRVVTPGNKPAVNLQAHLALEVPEATVYFAAVQEDGLFRFDDLPEGRYTLSIEEYVVRNQRESVRKQQKQTRFVVSLYLSAEAEVARIEIPLPEPIAN